MEHGLPHQPVPLAYEPQHDPEDYRDIIKNFLRVTIFQKTMYRDIWKTGRTLLIV